ncbi:MAG: hypothetical protein JW750_13035 [Anaerolineaceae bacterium]|nr:hypothetical protein [Anaerolineaceae bacterium]
MFEQFKQNNPIAKTRRNHALEHATLNLLTRKGVRSRLSGISTPGGFWLVGSVDPTLLQEAIEEAIERFNRGEGYLAISRNCGSNYAITGILAGLAAWLVMLIPGRNDFEHKLERLPLVILLVTFVTIISRPLGPKAQRYLFTDANIGDLRVTSIMLYRRGRLCLQKITTRG